MASSPWRNPCTTHAEKPAASCSPHCSSSWPHTYIHTHQTLLAATYIHTYIHTSKVAHLQHFLQIHYDLLEEGHKVLGLPDVSWHSFSQDIVRQNRVSGQHISHGRRCIHTYKRIDIYSLFGLNEKDEIVCFA